MQIRFEWPPNIEQHLRSNGGDLGREAKEVSLIDLFRRGVVSHRDRGQALDLDRFETNALLNRHQVTERSLFHEDVDADLRSINVLLAPPDPEIDDEAIEYCTREIAGKEIPSLEEVRRALAKIPGSMAQVVIEERGERF